MTDLMAAQAPLEWPITIVFSSTSRLFFINGSHLVLNDSRRRKIETDEQACFSINEWYRHRVLPYRSVRQRLPRYPGTILAIKFIIKQRKLWSNILTSSVLTEQTDKKKPKVRLRALRRLSSCKVLIYYSVHISCWMLNVTFSLPLDLACFAR
jgi:hypothetical protein